ncbi:MAG: GH32 C-terminal domain-containing protein [Sediminicola sp.]
MTGKIVILNVAMAFIFNGCELDTTDLAAHWKFDEEHGKSAQEEVLRIFDTIHYIFNTERPISDPIRRTGIVGEALIFDGFSSYIERDPDNFAMPKGSFSISAWVAPRSFEHGDGGKLSAIVNQQDLTKKAGFSLGMFRHGSWSFQIGTGDQWVEVWDNGNPLPKHQWSFLTATYNMSSGIMALFLNGKVISEKRISNILPIKAKNEPLLIGRHNRPETVTSGGKNFGLNMFNGLMDELKIYNKALMPEEIRKYYQTYLEAYDGKIPAISYDDIKIARSKYKGDVTRPEFHASPPGHWMNEPHAPLYFNGKYHMFYQHNPTGPYWHQIHWGHWVSDDMVHWKDLPEALYPENDTIAPDGIWSGSATYDENGKPVLLYTFGNWSKARNQGVALAFPKDVRDSNLTEWKKFPAPTIVQQPGQAMDSEFRDPFAWKDEKDRWFVLVGSGQRGPTVDHPEGTAWFYESENLYDWKLKGEFYKVDFEKYPEMAGIWELPVLLPLGTYSNGDVKYIFMCSPVIKGLSIRYFIGRIDHGKSVFVPDKESPQQMNYGESGFTAPSGFIDPKTGRAILFTLAHGGSGPGWHGNMGLPVEIGLDPDDELILNPIEELHNLRKKELVEVNDVDIMVANDNLKKVDGDMIEVLVELESISAERYGLKVRKSPKGEEETGIYYDNGAKVFGVDHSRSSLKSGMEEIYKDNYMTANPKGPINLKGENLVLHVFIDKTMLEVYANKRKAISTRTYPMLDTSNGLELFADGDIRVKSLRVWELSSIYYD